MDMSPAAYLAFLAAVGLGRLIEMGISRRNQRRLAARSIAKVPEPHFRWMVLLHASVLISAGLEVLLFRRPFIPPLAVAMGLLFLLANALRWWAIASLSVHWNIEVMASGKLGVVSDGPFRWIRHPNYVAVFTELITIPLLHSAWLTAILAGAGNYWVLRRRLAVEERILLADPVYRATMGEKPRFVPKLFARAPAISRARRGEPVGEKR